MGKNRHFMGLKCYFLFTLLITCLLFNNNNIYAKNGHDNIIFLIDISGSTQSKENNIPFKKFIQIIETLLNNYIETGDFVKFFAFSTYVFDLTPGQIISHNEKPEEKGILNIFKIFDEHYHDSYKKGDPRIQNTDFGLAFEAVIRYIEKSPPGDPANRNLILLLTDGKHDPSEKSNYNKKGKQLVNLLKQLVSKLHNQSWEIRCFGLGHNADLRILTEVLSLKNTVKSNDSNKILQSMSQAIRDKVVLNQSDISLTLSPSIIGNYQKMVESKLDIINQSNSKRMIKVDISRTEWFSETFTPWRFSVVNIKPEVFNLNPGENKTITLYIQQKNKYVAKQLQSFSGKIYFNFLSGARFYPTIIDINVNKISWFDAWKYLIVPFFLVVCVVSYFVFRRVVYGKKPTIEISIIQNGQCISEVSEKLKKGQSFIIGDHGVSIPGLKRTQAVTVEYVGNYQFSLTPSSDTQIVSDGKKYSSPIVYSINRMQRFSILDMKAKKETIIQDIEFKEGNVGEHLFDSSNIASGSDIFDTDSL